MGPDPGDRALLELAAADRKWLSTPSYSWLFDNRLHPRQPFYSLDDDYMSVDINLAREAALQLRHRARNEWVERRRMRFGTACERIMADIGEDLSVGYGEAE